jgi:exopolyphosphatase/guanosine-5'-triphosphate,3'-diphosphate pyrophosphatase
MRVAVVDIGTNSTRLLVADIDDGKVTELERHSTVTRLGRGVDTSGQLAADAIEDVCKTVGDYIAIYKPLSPDVVTAIATSAVRDAENSAVFLAELRERFALQARMLDGLEEAGLTYLGASADRSPADGTLVVDIGGGSTELVFGSGSEVNFYASLQAGTVRHTERYLTTDPPRADDLETLADDVRDLIFAELSDVDFFTVKHGIAVAGTPTSLAAIEQQLDPYDPDRVHGFRLSLDSIQRMCSMLASKTLEERLEVTGLHPGRAPTIVAGVVILIQVMRAFGLQEVEVSEHDILYGAALEAAGASPGSGAELVG